MTKTVLLYNPLPSPGPRPGVPLPLLALARMLPESRYRTIIVNGTVEARPHRAVMERLRDGVLVLGITAMTGYQIHDALRLVRKVRKRFPKISIVWGGYHPSLLAKETLQDACVDYVVSGQGEQPFARLVDLLSEGEKVAEVPGVLGPGSSDLCPSAPLSLDSFPLLPWHLIDFHRLPLGREGGWATDFYTSQGCPYSCAFCAEPAMHGKRRVTMSPERAVDEIAFLAEEGVREFHLRDTLFFANRHWVEMFCEELLRRNLQVTFYGVNGRVDQLMRLNAELWDLLDRVGFREVFLGIESGHRPALERICKEIEPEDSMNLLERAAQTRIGFSLSAMVGVPGVDAESEFRDTVTLLRRLIDRGPRTVSSVYLFSYAPYPGSELYGEAVEWGFRPPESLQGWGRLNLHTTNLPWGSKRRRRHAWFITRYVLPRVLGKEPSRIRIVEAVSRIVDPLLRRRWRSGRFDLFWEAGLYGGFNALRRVRRSFAWSSDR